MVANIATALHTTSDYLLGIEKDGVDVSKMTRILARSASTLSMEDKKALINALFGED